MASKRPRSVSPRVVRSLQSFAPELADLARYELSKRGMCSSVVLCNLDDDDFVLLRRCLPDPMWSVLPHVVMETRIACKQLVRGIRQSGYTPFCQIHRCCQFTELGGCARPKVSTIAESRKAQALGGSHPGGSRL